MARRSGKAANRRSRQRPARRPATRTSPTTGSAAAPANAETAELAPTVTAAPPVPPAVARPRRTGSTPIGSALAEAARAEYHYVGRDLRNMIVLVVIMAVLMGVAVFAFHAAGIVAS